MEIGPFRVHAVPRKIMLLHGQIAAFVEIAPDCSGRSKIREEQPQQLKRKLIRHIPATGRSFAGCKNPLENGKAEVQILFEPLQATISSMELPKNFENKKLPNPLR